MKHRTLLLGRLMGTALVIGLLVSLSACGSKPKGPRGALEAYGRALRGGDYAAAYEMMSASFRDQHSKEDFIRMMKESSLEVGETATRLRSTARSVEITAELRYGRGDRVHLVRENGTWRLASNPIRFYSQATPRDALRSFVRAYRLKRWDIMLRFVPNKFRQRMDADKMRQQFEGDSSEDADVMMKMLEANVEEPITDKGNEARMAFGDRYEVQLVREDGLWKIHEHRVGPGARIILARFCIECITGASTGTIGTAQGHLSPRPGLRATLRGPTLLPVPCFFRESKRVSDALQQRRKWLDPRACGLHE